MPSLWTAKRWREGFLFGLLVVLFGRSYRLLDASTAEQSSSPDSFDNGISAASSSSTSLKNDSLTAISSMTSTQDDKPSAQIQNNNESLQAYNTKEPPVQQPPSFNQTHYDLQLAQSVIPFSNVTTAAYFPLEFYSGYRNQGMVFHGFVMKCVELNHSQILLPSIRWKDQFGTNRRIQHDRLFDVVYWNSFYPKLPRLVEYDATLHYQLKPERKWNIDNPIENATHPYAIATRQNQMFIQYRRYTKILARRKSQQRDPTDTLMLNNAFRPNPGIQDIMDRYLESVMSTTTNTYMALHARVEPDMQKHPVCRDRKVVKLQDIFDMLHVKFPEPPVSRVLIMLGRHLLEQEDHNSNSVAKENLQVLNDAIKNGLWGGRVPVFEAGSDILKNSTFYEFAPSIGGSIVNYFLAVQADVFVGTEVSSFSTDVVTTRFVRGNLKNYKYVPDGIVQTTDENTRAPPPFVC